MLQMSPAVNVQMSTYSLQAAGKNNSHQAQNLYANDYIIPHALQPQENTI